MSLTANPLVATTHPTSELTTTDVDAIRSELLIRREAHAARLRNAQNHKTALGQDGAIDVGLAFERLSIDRSRDAVVDIDAAITRLDEGTYGSCETCHRPIARERLEAIPHARHCITCADSAPPSTGDRRPS